MSDFEVQLARLIVPSEREASCKELAADLPEQFVNLLARRLSDKRYTYRHNGLTSAKCKAILDRYIAEHKFSPTSPSRAMEYIGKYRELAPDAFTLEALRRGTVLDYGCGIHNPLSLGLILYLNGARQVLASDPGTLDAELARMSLQAFVLDFLEQPGKYALSGFATEKMKARFARIDWSRLLSADFSGARRSRIAFTNSGIRSLLPRFSSSVSLIVSTTVLEHVEDLAAELGVMRELLVPGGRMVHRIDFTDHRHFLPNYHPLAFVTDGFLTGLNGLRYKDVRSLFEAGGFGIDKEDLVRFRLGEDFLQRAHERFRGYTLAEMEITYAGVALTKR